MAHRPAPVTYPICPRCRIYPLIRTRTKSGTYRVGTTTIRLHKPSRSARCGDPGCGFSVEGPHIAAGDIMLPGSPSGDEFGPPRDG